MRKRLWAVGLVMAACGCAANASDGREYRSLSRQELDEKYAITEEEKKKLADMNIDIESFVREGEKEADDLIRRMELKDSDQHCLFLADGGVTCGKGEALTAYNDVLDKVKTVYNVDTDPNSLDWEETRYYLIQEHIRNELNWALGIEGGE
ncbi:MAG: hypothetical protein ACI32N_06370 [Bulleidia sp.]